MRCLKCGNLLEDDSRICSECGYVNHKEEADSLEFELPALKSDNKKPNELEISESPKMKEKTIAPIELEDDDLSLPAKIKSEVESTYSSKDTNEEEIKEYIKEESKDDDYLEESSNVAILNDEEDYPDSTPEKVLEENEVEIEGMDNEPLVSIETSESVAKRKKTLIVTSIVCLVLLIIIGVSFKSLITSSPETPSKGDYLENTQNSLKSYYETEKIDDVIYLLEENKDDEDKINKIQSKVKETCDNWIVEYLDTEAKSKSEFDKLTQKYKNLFNGLYDYAKVTKDDDYIRALSETNRDNYIKQIDNIYNYSKVFYDALELYNEKDYDKAYSIFESIDENNIYIGKSRTYRNTIIDTVIDMLENDIKKIEQNIDKLTASEKLKKYSLIEKVVLEYSVLYGNLHLNNQERYTTILDNYRNKINEYTYVSSKEDNNSN